MNLDTFFEKFGLFADAPNAVAKMRELILDLAVRGKLVPQDRNDVPAARTLSSVGIDLSKCLLNSAEQRYVVPDSWFWIEFSNIGEQRLGKMLDAQKNKGVSRRYLRNTNVQWMRFDLNDIKEMRIEESECDDLRLRKGDLLICEGGEPGRCAIWNDESSEMYFQKALHRVRPCDAVLSEYLALNLRIDCLNGVLERYFTGATIKHLTGRSLGDYPIAIPPLAEQKRIVAKVDELMALCDRLEAQQQERETRHTALAQASLTRFADAPTPANLEFLFHKSYAVEPAELRKTILTLAVLGRLVPQDVADDPPSSSFHGIKAQDTNVWGGTEIPNQWILSHYRSLTSLVTSGSRGWKEYYSNSGAIFIRTQNIKTDRLVLDDVAFVDLPKSTEGMRTQVMKNDIMITITGANVTKAARVEESIAEAYVSQHIALTRPRWPDMSKWLHLCFLSDGAARGVLEKLAYGDKPGLNLNNIRDLVMPIPPLPEQKRIVAKVEQLMALVDRLEAQLVESRGKGAALLEAVVAELSGAV